MNNLKKWIIAARLETIVLALASVGLGSALAASTGSFDWRLGLLTALTAALLQIICNLANDYGDFTHGADPVNKCKPPSAIQVGLVTLKQVKHALQLLLVPTLGLGMLLIYLGQLSSLALFIFVGLGAAAIIAAVAYTMGKKPYGYQGWGDVAVLVFFGLVGVGGTFYLHTKQSGTIWLLPAISYGSLVVAVLNVNNIRDITSDAQVGKKTIPVRIGKKAAIYYHWGLLTISTMAVLAFLLRYVNSPWPYLCLCTLPALIRHGMAVGRQDPAQLTKQLQNLVLTIFVFVCLLAAGLVL
jgi:1,4-dihydroxy-2-naphthoate octaprenyltransferase